VFRGKGKLGHIRCWRPDPPAKSPDTSGLPPTGPCEQPDSVLAPAAGALEAAPDHRDASHGRAISREEHNQRLPLHCE
jgi:hypothetical protein